MNTWIRQITLIRAFALSAAVTGFLASASSVRAQGLPGEGNIRFSTPINAATDVRWDQRLDNQISLNTTFRDEAGIITPLSTYFGKRPVVLVMPFYRCPGICTAELNGLVDTFKDEKMNYRVGRDFDVVTVSINPNEGPDLATMKKREYLDMLAQPGAETGWHFLTGSDASIHKLADDVGFRYKYNPENNQYAHPGGIVVLTPSGKVSRYFFGAVFSPKDSQLALTEAGNGRIGTVEDKFVLYCYHYDPQTGRYGLQIFRLMQILGFATVFTLGGFMFLAFRKDAVDAKRTRTDTVGDESSEVETVHVTL